MYVISCTNENFEFEFQMVFLNDSYSPNYRPCKNGGREAALNIDFCFLNLITMVQ